VPKYSTSVKSMTTLLGRTAHSGERMKKRLTADIFM
jgi:hypothetical protein